MAARSFGEPKGAYAVASRLGSEDLDLPLKVQGGHREISHFSASLCRLMRLNHKSSSDTISIFVMERYNRDKRQ